MRALPAGRHFFRGSDGYEAARRGTVWHRRVPDRYPEVIVQAVSADDIVSAIRYATVNGHKVATAGESVSEVICCRADTAGTAGSTARRARA